MSQKVLWKILCPMVHSIVGMPGSSFLARNGKVRRWSYSDRSVLIMLTNSSGDCLALFFLLYVLLLLSHCCLFGQVRCLWMSRRLQDTIFDRKLLLFILDCEADLSTIHIDDGFAVLKKGRPRMMGALSSPPISKTTRSMGTYDCPTRTMASSRTPLG